MLYLVVVFSVETVGSCMVILKRFRTVDIVMY